MIILLDVGLNVPRPSTHVVGVVGTTEAVDVHQVRSDMSYLRILGDLTVKYSPIFASDR